MIKILIELPDPNRRILSRAQVIEILCFEVVLVNAVAAGWLEPLGKTGNNARGSEMYSRKEVEAVEARILSGEMPPPKSNRAA